MLPVDWKPGEDSPRMFLKELESFPGYAEAVAGTPVPVELSAEPGTSKPEKASGTVPRVEPRTVSKPENMIASRHVPPANLTEPMDKSVVERLTKVDTSDRKPVALGRRANNVSALKPSAPFDPSSLDAFTPTADGVRVAAGLVPEAPSRGETLFTNVLINLITIFAALVFGLFALLSAVMLVFRGKLKGAGLNFRVELVANRPLAQLTVTANPTVTAPGGYAPAATAATAYGRAARTDAAMDESDDDVEVIDPASIAFDPPIFSLAQQREEEEREMRQREQAILTQILEQNVELREQLQEMEGESP
jgi:hypothetical protein